VAYYSLAGKGKHKYSFTFIPISLQAPSPPSWCVKRKTRLRPVFREDEFPGSRSAVATDTALKQNR
jgi:hypothetical protein